MPTGRAVADLDHRLQGVDKKYRPHPHERRLLRRRPDAVLMAPGPGGAGSSVPHQTHGDSRALPAPAVARKSAGMTSSTRTAAGRESPYRGFLPVVGLEELPLVTAFLDATAFLAGGGGLAAIVFPTALPLGVAFLTTPRRDPDPPVFFATPVAPEGFGAGRRPPSAAHHTEDAWAGDEARLPTAVPPHGNQDAADRRHNTGSRPPL